MRHHRGIVFWLAATLVLVAGCTTMADQASEAEKIAAVNKKWLGMVVRKDAAAIGNLYTSDGVFMMPNAPIVTGPKAIGEAWNGLLQLPALSLNFRTTQLVIAKSGDLASDRGTYDLAFDGEKGRVRDVGKYVVVWKKVDGQWKVLADIFNSDLKP